MCAKYQENDGTRIYVLLCFVDVSLLFSRWISRRPLHDYGVEITPVHIILDPGLAQKPVWTLQRREPFLSSSVRNLTLMP